MNTMKTASHVDVDKWLEKGKEKLRDTSDEFSSEMIEGVGLGIVEEENNVKPETPPSEPIQGILGSIEQEEKRDIYQPLCFSRDTFNRPDFDAGAFISDCRSRVPLESFLNDLNEYAASLERELLYIINRDYSSFVSLSTSLVGLDKVIVILRSPLSEMQGQVAAMLMEIEGYMRILHEKLKEKAAVAEKRQLLELFVEAHKSVEKIETLLHIDNNANKREHGREERIAAILMKSDEETCKLIQRVANEYNQLKIHLAKGKGYPFFTRMDRRITFIENSLQRGLEKMFQEGLAARNMEVILTCLRTFSAIDRATEAENLFRLFVAQPFFEKTITIDNLEKGKKRSSDGLGDIYSAILAWLESDMKPLLEPIHKSVRDVDMLTNAILVEFVTHAEKTLSRIFLPALPDVFFQTALRSAQFIKEFESFAPDKERLQAFRSNPAYVKFQKKWEVNANSYFQLRFNDIAPKLDNCLVTNPPSQIAPPSSRTTFSLAGSSLLWQCLNQCWIEGVYMPQLTHRFYKLALQLLSRYQRWLSTNLPETTVRARAAGDSFVLTDLLYIIHDIDLMILRVKDQYIPTVNKTVSPHFPESVLPIFSEGLLSMIDELTAVKTLAGERLCSIILAECAYNLQPLRGITQTYMYTDKPMPSRPSYYVPRVLHPLNEFCNKFNAYMSAESRAAWCLAIASQMTDKFYDMVVELLGNLQKMEENLKRLPGKRGINEGGESSDKQKILRQLQLDIEEYGKLLGAAHPQAPEQANYIKLIQLTRKENH